MSDLQAGQETPVVDNEAQVEAAQQPQADSGVQDTEASTQEKETPVERTFTQKDIEAATAKAAAKAERRAYREAMERMERLQQPQQPRQEDQRPQRHDGESDDAYLDRLTDWKLDKRDQQSRHQREAERVKQLTTKTESIYAQAEKEAGFDREEFDSLPITPSIAEAITDSDIAPKLMAYMSANPEDVARIAKLSPARQAAEIGKLEDKLASARTTRAPAPIRPVGNRGSGVPDLEKMSFNEYAKWREQNR